MAILGKYSLANYYEINVHEHKNDDIESTLVHENIHLLLTQTTVWGSLEYSLKKINYIDNRCIALSIFLSDQVKKIHEGTAVFFELMYTLKKEGEVRAKEKINNLRSFNKEYYGYIKPLLKYVNYCIEKFSSNPEEVDKVSTVIYYMSVSALNSEIYKIDTSNFVSRKNIQKFTSNPRLSDGILPIQLFKSYCKGLDSILNNVINLEVNEILEKFIDFEKTIEYLHTKNERIKSFELIKSFILEIYHDSNRIIEIKNYLKTITIKSVDITDSLLYGIPSSYRKLKECTLDKRKLENNLFTHAIFFYIGSVTEGINKIKERYFIDFIEDEEAFKVVSNQYFFCIMDIVSNTNNMYSGTKESIQNIVDKYNNILLISYTSFDFENMKVKGLSNSNRILYIYCDRAYPYTIDIIKSMETHIEYSTIIDYDIMDVLYIKLIDNNVFILPILKIVREKIIADSIDKIININLIELRKSNYFDDTIHADENGERFKYVSHDMLNEMDAIISTIFDF